MQFVGILVRCRDQLSAVVEDKCGSGASDIELGKERVLGALPFFHVFAMTVVMLYGIANAAEIIIMPRFVLDDAMKLIDKTKPTVMPGVPTMFIAMLNHPKLASFDLSSLKFCLSGGAPLPAADAARLLSVAQTGDGTETLAPGDRKSTRLNSSHQSVSRMPSSA